MPCVAKFAPVLITENAVISIVPTRGASIMRAPCCLPTSENDFKANNNDFKADIYPIFTGLKMLNFSSLIILYIDR